MSKNGIIMMGKWKMACTMIITLFACNANNEKVRPVQTALTESVYASATVQPDSMYAVYASVGGIISENLVEAGDLVQKDDGLIRMINRTPELSKENARLAWELSRKNLEGKSTVLSELENEIVSAKSKFENDSTLYIQQKRLWDQEIGSKTEYDARKLAFEVSRNNLNSLRNRLERTRLELQTQLQQAENNYASSEVLNEDYTVKSNMNGKVYDVLKNPGELVSGVEPIAYVGSRDRFVLELLVDEVDITRVRLGQEVLVLLDAYNNQVFIATVEEIPPRMDPRSRTFLVEAHFQQTPDVLYSGLTGEANIIIAEKEAVLTIPRDYLINDHQVNTEEGIRDIETGLKDLQRVEVISGLDTTDVLVKPE